MSWALKRPGKGIIFSALLYPLCTLLSGAWRQPELALFTGTTKAALLSGIQNAQPVCCGLNCVPENSYVRVLTPAPQNMALFGDKVLIEVIKVKTRSLGWAQIQRDCFHQRGKCGCRDTEGRWRRFISQPRGSLAPRLPLPLP